MPRTTIGTIETKETKETKEMTRTLLLKGDFSLVSLVSLRELVCLLLVHRCEELVVVAGEVHLLLQELHGLDGGHIREVFAQYPCALHNAL